MLKDILLDNRSYRSFDPRVRLTKAQLMDMIAHARLTPSSTNLQALKFYLSSDGQINEKILPLTRWAGLLKECELPPKGHGPVAYIVVCIDKSLAENSTPFLKDVGIAAHTILLRAAETGLGGCMIGSFDRKRLCENLGLDADMEPHLVIALGKPDETVILEDAAQGEPVAYYRTADGIHHVPKRSVKEMIL